MGQNDDHIRQDDEDPSRTLDAVKPLYELGSRIGGYKLLSVLGEGGFGMVYLAEQQHPIKRLVALKVIKPGMVPRIYGTRCASFVTSTSQKSGWVWTQAW